MGKEQDHATAEALLQVSRAFWTMTVFDVDSRPATMNKKSGTGRVPVRATMRIN
jgi:hypothetical protein